MLRFPLEGIEIDIYAGSRKVFHVRRHFQWFYKKFLYKPVQQELKPEETAQK